MSRNETTKQIIGIIIGLLFLVFLCCMSLWAIIYNSYTEHNKLIHIDTPNQSHCITAVKLHKEQSGITVETEEFGELYLSNGTYIIIDNGVCPYCKPETTN